MSFYVQKYFITILPKCMNSELQSSKESNILGTMRVSQTLTAFFKAKKAKNWIFIWSGPPKLGMLYNFCLKSFLIRGTKVPPYEVP